jgi:DNA-binding protein YbaB
LADWQQHNPQPGQPGDRRTSLSEQDLAARTVEVDAGAGAVRVRVDGRGRVRHLAIEPGAFAGRDHELLADLILGALAEAQRRAGELAAQADRPAGSSPEDR